MFFPLCLKASMSSVVRELFNAMTMPLVLMVIFSNRSSDSMR